MMFRLSDVGLAVLLSFFSMLVSIIGGMFQVDLLNDFAAKLPQSVHAAKNFLGGKGYPFCKWASCPSCSTLYPLNDSKKYTFVRYPNHPHAHLRKPC